MKRAFAASACVIFGIASCQVINSFDDVKQPVDEAGAGTGGGGGTTGGGGGDAGSGGTSASGGVGGDSGTGGTGGTTGGTAGAAGADSGPTREGLIVIAGRDAGNPILITLDPETGGELKREALTQPVRGIGYDAQRDLWFLFQRHDSGDPFDPATLRVGTFDLQTGAFQEVSTTSVPAPESAGGIAVLKDRILYKSNLPPVGTPPQAPLGLTLLDTTTPTAVVVRGQPQSPLPAGGARGMVARPALAAAGGTVTLVQTLSPCYDFPNWPADAGTAPKVCDVQVENALVAATANAPTFPVARVVGSILQAGSSPGWTSSASALMVLLPPLRYQVDPLGSVLRLRPDNLQEQLAPIPFPAAGPFISSAAYDRCLEVVIATEFLTSQSIFVIPTTAGGTIHTEPLPNSAQRAVFEPFTRTVIRPFVDNSNPELTAYVLGGTKTAPTLAQRPQPGLPWAPPTQINADILVVRDPGTVTCPAP